MAVVGSDATLPGAKATRQWDAWTREEEENFFGALRQVGKNFDKITSRVQSKNKDQVRHYYYRVIKRMNRILAPTLILDAKNSTYVNSAMLRWWSLLEKHSCSASKLRLKPRRFKTFVTALEHQLLKDHNKKTKPKKPGLVAISSRKHAGGTTHVVDMAAVGANGLPELVTSGSGDDSQSGQGSGSVSRRAAIKRKAGCNGPHKAEAKGEVTKRLPRPRKKATDGNSSKAAYANWEKEASVGVSLMAEAAEQLERATAADVPLPASKALSDPQIANNAGGNLADGDLRIDDVPSTSSAVALSDMELTGQDQIAGELLRGPSLHSESNGSVLSPSRQKRTLCNPQAATGPSSSSAVGFNCQQDVGAPEIRAQVHQAKSVSVDATRCNNCSKLRGSGSGSGTDECKGDMTTSKLKLQLFPFDDFIRKALEQDGLNPHLELTLTSRKSISSVLHRLVQKWGRSAVASGELRLYPFNTQWSNVRACRSWGFQDHVSAADVHAALGKPGVFRLRYAWLSSRVLESPFAVQHNRCVHIANYLGAERLEGPCPSTASGCAVRDASDMPNAAILQSLCATNSGLATAEQCRLSDQARLSSTKSAGVYEKDAHADSLLLKTASHVAVLYAETAQRPCAVPLSQPEHELVRKSSFTNATPAAAVKAQRGKDCNEPVTNLALLSGAEVESLHRSICKESANQVSGCAWLYESNDGFAQHLWNQEETLRSGNCISEVQMDWVDGLTNISVSELLGDASRPVFSSNTADSPHSCTGQTQLTCLDSFDIALAGQEVPAPGMLISGDHTSTTIWGGDDTCDAFSFPRPERSNSRDAIMSLGEEPFAKSSGLDVTLADFRSMASWKEGESLTGLDLARQAQRCQSEDLFDGDVSVGLSGLIEALAQGSLDEFQASAINHCVGLGGRDSEAHVSGCGGDGEAAAQPEDGNCHGELISKGESSQAALADLCQIGGLSNGNIELIDICNRAPKTSLPDVTSLSEDGESLKEGKASNPKFSRKEELHSSQRSLNLAGQFSTVRSLKFQV